MLSKGTRVLFTSGEYKNERGQIVGIAPRRRSVEAIVYKVEIESGDVVAATSGSFDVLDGSSENKGRAATLRRDMMSNHDVERFLTRWINIATGESQEFADDTAALSAFAIEAEQIMKTKTLKLDRAVELLDERYPRWDLYREAGRWWVKLPDEILSGNTLSAVLQAAVAYVPLPKYPRRPELLGIDRFTYHKEGRKWWVKYDGKDYSIAAKNKKTVIEICERRVELSKQEYDVWVRTYAHLVEGKTEDVDFRWEW